MRNLKRALSLALAAIMVLGLMVVGASAASTYDNFTDKDEIVNTEAVNTMVSLGVLAGKDDGSYFDPTGIVTRGEMAKIVAVCLNGGKEPVLGDSTNIPKFSDVPSTHWAYNYVAYCVQQGIIAGRGDGTFAPDEPVTGSAAAKMFLCALGYRADLEGLVGNEWELNTNVLANQDAKLYEGLEGINASEGLTRDNTAQMAYNAVQAQEVTYNNLFGDYTGVLQTEKGNTMLTNRFRVVKVTGILEANDKLSVASGVVDANGNRIGHTFGSTALDGKSLLRVTNVAGKETVNYSSLMGAQTFTVDTSDEMVGQEIVLYVRFTNELAPNASSSTVIGSPILTDNNTVVETSARLKDAAAVRSTLREGGMSNIGTPTAFLYTENEPVYGVATGITDSISATLRPDVAVASYNERSAGIFQRFIDNDGNGEPDYIVQIVPVLSSVNSISTDGEDYTFTGINGTVSVADIVTDETLARNDVVLINRYADDCYYVSYPETVEGTVTAFNTNNNTVTVDGTSYGNSGGKMLGVSGVDQFLTEEETIDSTFIFYLDPAGNVLGYKETDSVIGNYAIVKGFDRTGNAQMGYSATVKLLMQDSTTATYSLNLAASAVNLGLADASASTTAKEDAITKNNAGYVGNPANYNAADPTSDGYLLINHLFSYTLDNGTVTLGRPYHVNDNYRSNKVVNGTLQNTSDLNVTTISKNTAEYATVSDGKIVANDQTVFFVKDSTSEIFVVTGLSKLPADKLTITSGESVSYVAPGTSTQIAKAVFVTTNEVYKAARDYVYVTDKYVRTNTSGTPVYSFTVVYPDGTTGTMETKSNVNTIKNKVCEYDYDGSYVNFYPDETSMYNKYYVKSVANNTVTLGNIDTGATVASLRIATGAAIWDVQDDPAADSLAENDVVSLITDTEGAVKAAFIYDVMNGKFVSNPLTGENGSSVKVNTTVLTADGQHVATTTLNEKDQITVTVTVPSTMNAPVLTINGTTSVTMTRPSAAALVAAATTTYTYEYVYTVTAADAARGYVTFSVKLSQSGLDPMVLTWTAGVKAPDGGTVTPPAEGEYTVTVTVDGTTDTTLTKNVKEGEAYSATYTAPTGKIISAVSPATAGTIAADKKSVALSIASVTKAETIAITLADEGTVTPPAGDFDPELEVKAPATEGDPYTATMNYYLAEGETLADKASWIKDQLNASGALSEQVYLVTNVTASGATALNEALEEICTITLTPQYKVSVDGTTIGYYDGSTNGVVLTGYVAPEGSKLISGKAPTDTPESSQSTAVGLDGVAKTTVNVASADLDLWTAYELNLPTAKPTVEVTAYQVEGGQKVTGSTAEAVTTGHYIVPDTQIWVSVTGDAEGDLMTLSLNGTALTTEPLKAPVTPFTVAYTSAITLSGVDAETNKYEFTTAKVYKLMIDGTTLSGYVSASGANQLVLPNSYASQAGKKFVQIKSNAVSCAEAALAEITISDGKVLLGDVTLTDQMEGTIVVGTAVKVGFGSDYATKFAATAEASWRNGAAKETVTVAETVYVALNTTLTIESADGDGTDVMDKDMILVAVGTGEPKVADSKGNAATWSSPDGTPADATYTVSGTEDLTFSVGADPNAAP